MIRSTVFSTLPLLIAICQLTPIATAEESRDPLDPRGEVHMPIGIADSVDALKTFVEAEGNFSPGFATYGIYFWLRDPAARKLIAPTQEDVPCERGLAGVGHLIPWSRWRAGTITVRTEVCQVERDSPAGRIQIVTARVLLKNTGDRPRRISLYVALRPVGAAGGNVRSIEVSSQGDAILVDRHPALIATTPPTTAGVTGEDRIGDLASRGEMPTARVATSESGDGSGALRFDIELAPDAERQFAFLCPVLPGRRAVSHEWDGTSKWAQLDLARPHPAEGGALQGDPGLDHYRSLDTDALFREAHEYWNDLVGRVKVRVPDQRWSECFAAIIGHAAMEMNEGAPDVAVTNYNVFNRDGVYVANILQKSGNIELAARALDYFLEHPFNGRTRVEADNPGQVLWALGEHWRFTRDRRWLERIFPAAAKIAAMIRYYRTTPGPHLVKANSLEFGESLPPDRPEEKPAHRRQELVPGSCDGHHPEYTEAFDIAGLRAAVELARAARRPSEKAAWEPLTTRLMDSYDRMFGDKLPAGYGNYCVLWPCRLYSLEDAKALRQFGKQGPTSPGGWRYFALAKAHQGLLAGNRAAGHETISRHLEHPQMRGWYVLDEGGKSGAGGWRFARTPWKSGVAMPHGWAIAEMWLLMRDCLAYEEGGRLHLLRGVPDDWLSEGDGLAIENLPTHFGLLTMAWWPAARGAQLELDGDADPPDGFVITLPAELRARVNVDEKPAPRSRRDEYLIPRGTRSVHMEWLE